MWMIRTPYQITNYSSPRAWLQPLWSSLLRHPTDYPWAHLSERRLDEFPVRTLWSQVVTTWRPAQLRPPNTMVNNHHAMGKLTTNGPVSAMFNYQRVHENTRSETSLNWIMWLKKHVLSNLGMPGCQNLKQSMANTANTPTVWTCSYREYLSIWSVVEPTTLKNMNVN